MIKTLVIALYIISFSLIFEQIFRLTNFILRYNYSYDYGKILRKICDKEYMEYETSRFNLVLSEKDLEIKNTNKNKKEYLLLVLIISIIFTLTISIIFSTIIYNIYCNIDSDKFNEYNLLHKIYILIILIICIITIIYPLILIIYQLKKTIIIKLKIF